MIARLFPRRFLGLGHSATTPLQAAQAIWALAATFAFLMALVAPSAALAQASVEFKITATADGAPVSGLDVLVDGNPGLVTDANGQAGALVKSGERLIEVEQDGALVATFVFLAGVGDSVNTTVDLSGADAVIDTKVSQALIEGEPGFLKGRIVASNQSGNLLGAQIFVEGANVEANANDEGYYEARVPAGIYTVYAIHPNYSTQIKEEIRILPGQTAELNIDMTPQGVSRLADFIVLAPALEGSLESALDTRRELSNVADVISTEAIERAGDGDAAAALKRVTGLTVVGGKFVYVRGLGERYSLSLLNGASLPSPDPARRVVPLDLFPTSVIESIEVQKAYSADLPGDFSGGAVIIRSNSFPVNKLFEMGAQLTGNTDTTFKTGLTYDGDTTDYLGFDDDQRELPTVINVLGNNNIRIDRQTFNASQLEFLGEQFQANYDVYETDTPLGGDLDMSIGNLFALTDTINLGVVAAGSYSNSYRTRTRDVRDFRGPDLISNVDFRSLETERTIDASGFFNVGLEIGEQNVVTSTTMILRNTNDIAEVRRGLSIDIDSFSRTILEFTERTLLLEQLAGEHFFDLPWAPGSSLNWQFAAAYARLDRPDTRSYLFDGPDLDSLTFSNRGDNNLREFAEQDENILTGGFDFAFPFAPTADIQLTAKVGMSVNDRDRETAVRRYTFEGGSSDPETRNASSLEDILNAENIRDGEFELLEITRASDSYDATTENFAMYASADTVYKDALRVVAGLRFEDHRQEVVTFNPFQPTDRVVGLLDEQDVMPALNVSYTWPNDLVLRGGFSKTVNRPDVRELSQSPFTDPDTRRETVGNPNLTQADVTNYDIRVEWFPSPSEVLSAGIFYKQLDRPIEQVVEAGAAQRLTYENALEADNFGVEFEAGIGLGKFQPWLQGWGTTANLSIIESEVTTDPNSGNIITNDTRALQGQSDFVFNWAITYDGANDLKATLLYNVFGDRIAEVGSLGAPDRIEESFHAVDFVISRPFMGLGWKFKIRNLLDQETVITQGGLDQQVFSRGQDFSLSVKKEFF